MSQRGSGYRRKKNDAYQTPAWVTAALAPHLAKIALHVWEPAAGKGQMVRALSRFGFKVASTDITRGIDFLNTKAQPKLYDAIVTNPPYRMHDAFIKRALELTEPNGIVAMLLRVDFDSGKTRHRFFRDHPAWSKKIVLTRRIIWFNRPGAATSYNHAWFIWNWRHKGPPTITYA